MKINIFWIPLTMLLAVSVQIANAQKVYIQGVATYTTIKDTASYETKTYFSADSSASLGPMGLGTSKFIANADGTYFVLCIFTPDGSIKKAGILTAAEIKEIKQQMPTYTFTPTTDTKQINGFHCKKIIARDTKTNIDYDVWVTNDIKIPTISVLNSFAALNAEVVQSPLINGNQYVLKSITEEKVPTGFFSIPAGFVKMASIGDLFKSLMPTGTQTGIDPNFEKP